MISKDKWEVTIFADLLSTLQDRLRGNPQQAESKGAEVISDASCQLGKVKRSRGGFWCFSWFLCIHGGAAWTVLRTFSLRFSMFETPPPISRLNLTDVDQ